MTQEDKDRLTREVIISIFKQMGHTYPCAAKEAWRLQFAAERDCSIRKPLWDDVQKRAIEEHINATTS